MEQVMVAWRHRFWIVLGVAVLLPIVGYFADTRGLASNAQQRAAQIQNLRKELEQLKRGPNPNDHWVAAVKQLELQMRRDVDGAWEELYRRQLKFTVWPEGFEPLASDPTPTGEPLTRMLIRYKDAWQEEFAEIFRSVKPVTIFGDNGLVEVDTSEYNKFRQGWLGPGLYPSVAEARLAQENLWILRALFDVAALATHDAKNIRQSPVKLILGIEIGPAALDDRTSKTVQALIPFEGEAASSALPAVGSATGTIRREAAGRYVPSRDPKLFKLLPLYMRLTVDQRQVVRVLCEFANSGIPMQITQAAFHRASEREETSTLGLGLERRSVTRGTSVKKAEEQIGAAPPKEDEFFHMTELEVWAQAVLFQPPPSFAQEQQVAEVGTEQTATEPEPKAKPTAGKPAAKQDQEQEPATRQSAEQPATKEPVEKAPAKTTPEAEQKAAGQKRPEARPTTTEKEQQKQDQASQEAQTPSVAAEKSGSAQQHKTD